MELAGRYRLERPLGQSGSIEVWEGIDTVLARPVVVEIAEAAVPPPAAAGLRHPAVCAVYDSGTQGGRAYVVTEAVHGPTLAELARPGGMPLAAAVDALIQLTDAVAHGHAAGAAHGALDAGAVVWHEGRVRVRGSWRARASPDDVAADLTALGAVAFEALTGHSPAEVPGLRPRQLRAGIPRSLDEAVTRAVAGAYRSAADFRADLAAVDIGDDDAVPLVVADDTPPQGTAPSFRQTERTWLLPAAVIVVLAAAVGLAGVLVAGTDVGRRILPGTARSPAAVPATVVSATAFDPPPGDGHEHDADTALAIDGNPATAWRTQRYSRADLGGLKPGVGLVLHLDRPRRLDRLVVRSPTTGWAASVYVGAPASTLAGWGNPVATRSALAGEVAFPLRGRSGRAVLLWITRLGAVPGGWAVAVAEVQVFARG